MKKILQALEDFVSAISRKGYQGTFRVGDRYVGRLPDCLSEYLEASVTGRENGFRNDIKLECLLLWTGEKDDFINCSMQAGYKNGRIEVKQLEVSLVNNRNIKTTLNFNDLNINSLPTRQQSIAKIREVTRQSNEEHIRPRPKRRIKL